MENLKELNSEELMEIQGGDCDCPATAQWIGETAASVANYFDRLGSALGQVNWFGVL